MRIATRTFMLALAVLALVPARVEAKRLARSQPLKTGQTTSYGAAGDTTAGVSPMYNDLGNGVIKDQRTGLFWEKKSDDGSIHDWDNDYSWSTGSPWNFDGTAASVFLTTLNAEPCFAGFCDWRQPTLNELETIRDLGNVDPAVPAVFNTSCTAGCTVTTCSCTSSSYYWSSSTFRYHPGYAWFVDFYSGGDFYDFKTDGYYVRAVRGGS